jgi:hypothetical protein
MASVEQPTQTQGSPPSPSSSPTSLSPPSSFTYHTPLPSPGIEQISSFPRVHIGFDKPATTTDPFAAQREGGNPFSNGSNASTAAEAGTEPVEIQSGMKNTADEWGTFFFFFSFLVFMIIMGCRKTPLPQIPTRTSHHSKLMLV